VKGVNSMAENIVEKFEKLFKGKYKIYYSSIRKLEKSFFFMIRDQRQKYLISIAKKGICEKFEGKKIGRINDLDILMCPTNDYNCKVIRTLFNINPSVCKKNTSFGFGDRLGLATPAHTTLINKYDVFPVLAQQSVRELSRTHRNFKDVLDSAIWGIFESGYEGEFGADADHVKDINDLMQAAYEGYSMYTVDPSDHVKNVDKINQGELVEFYKSHPLRKEIEMIYSGKVFSFEKSKFTMEDKELFRIFVTYVDAIEHVVKCYEAIKNTKKNFDFEVSIDETSIPTSPLAHIFIVHELRRRGVDFQTLALRFVGQWQKAIDYIGDLSVLESELSMHCEIVKSLSGYRLSLHSGSDKFSVYRIFTHYCDGKLHVKTAGTSYLEAIRTVAEASPSLYRNIHKYALTCFEKDNTSYHVTADINKIPDVDNVEDSKVVNLLDIPEVRQLIHITYGSVLTEKINGKYLFRDEIYRILHENEFLHYKRIRDHLGKHLELLKN